MNKELVKKINAVYKLLEFPKLKKLYNTRVRILVALHCNTFISADLSLNLFKHAMGMIDTLNSMRITLDKNILGKRDLFRFCKSVQITAAKYVAINDKALLVKLRRDIAFHS